MEPLSNGNVEKFGDKMTKVTIFVRLLKFGNTESKYPEIMLPLTTKFVILGHLPNPLNEVIPLFEQTKEDKLGNRDISIPPPSAGLPVPLSVYVIGVLGLPQLIDIICERFGDVISIFILESMGNS